MSTPFQLDANRRNAKFSTGPRTQAGKAASSRNATKHNLTGTTFVILPGEDIDAFERLSREYRDEWKPATPHETFLVNGMVQARWRLDRIARMQAEAFDQLLNAPAADGKTDEGALVALYPIRGQLLDKLERYARDNERAYHRAVRELRAYRKAQTVDTRREQPRDAAERNEPNCAFHEPVAEAVGMEPQPSGTGAIKHLPAIPQLPFTRACPHLEPAAI